MLIVPEHEMSGLMTPEAAFDAVERVFSAMSSREARNFPVVREAIGHKDALYGFKGGFDRTGMALGLKAGGYWPGNASEFGLINHQSAVFLFDPDTGRLRAIVGGNLLTALRTAAASAVSIRHLARKNARVLGIVGAGHQAAFQLRAALGVGQFNKIVAWNRSPERVSTLASVAEEAGVEFQGVDLPGMVEADVVITITSSFAAILEADHVSPGTHLAVMGTDTKGKQEVAAELVASASVFTDEIAQSVSIGEAQHAVAGGLIRSEAITEIGAVINGTHPGRQNDDEITLFDGTGVGLQDLAVAAAAVDLAVERGLAIEVEF